MLYDNFDCDIIMVNFGYIWLLLILIGDFMIWYFYVYVFKSIKSVVSIDKGYDWFMYFC